MSESNSYECLRIVRFGKNILKQIWFNLSETVQVQLKIDSSICETTSSVLNASP